MVILCLGSNIGDRLAHLRKSLKAIQNLDHLEVQQVSPVYVSDALVPEGAPAAWNQPYLNVALRCKVNLEPQVLLSQLKEIEWSIGRKPEVRHWGPRILDIDILAWDDAIIKTDQLSIPHKSLVDRPFALWPLADIAPRWRYPLAGPLQDKTAAELVEVWGSRFSGEAPFRTRQLLQRIDTPQLVGIINVTPDSFSDGNRYCTVPQALAQIKQLVEGGADVIDLGAESTAPKAQAITAEMEWQRLEPILTAFKKQQNEFSIPPKISIDTRHADVARKALDYGIAWINDVSGLDDPGMREVVMASGVDCVVMHHLLIPERRDQVLPRGEDSIQIVYEWGEKRIAELEKAGLPRSRIIFDPGIGFGKMAEQSLYLLQNTEIFSKLGTRLLVGHSRKTFFSLLTQEPFAERDVETTAASLFLANQSVDYLRLHNVGMTARAYRVAQALRTSATV